MLWRVPCSVVSFSQAGFALEKKQESRIDVPDDRVSVGELLYTDSAPNSQPVCC